MPVPSTIEERVVVSASAATERLLDAPAAVSVLDGEVLETAPGDTLVDHLRRVPGINVVQFSARDTNIASRGATGGINNSTLALADGRSLYQDFLGFILWEFAPTDASLIESIEVVRGPASSLWGANAVGGLVHVLTRSPRDTPGGQLVVEAGSYDMKRFEAWDSFLAGPWSVRASAGYLESDAFDRPETITNFLGQTIDADLGLQTDTGNDSGTKQPRLDVRADWDGPSGTRWSLQGGWGRTRGWIATGLGPFDIDDGTSSSHASARFESGPYEIQADVSYFDGQAVNLINALPFAFTSGVTHAAFRGRQVLGQRGLAGFGLDLGRSVYDLSIAPGGDRRTQAALYGEVDYRLAGKLWGVAGARVDQVEETIGTVFSPRVALRYQLSDKQTLRAAWGEAFRAPSVIETNLEVPSIPVAVLDWEAIDATLDPVTFPFGFFAPLAEVVCESQPDNCGVPPGETPDYIATTAARGSPDLHEEVTRSLELGYAAQLGRFDISATMYANHSEGGIDFPRVANYGYGADGVPGTADDVILPSDPDGDGIAEAPPVDVCPYLEAISPFNTLCLTGPVPYNEALSLLLDGRIPALFQYANGATTRNRGFELGGGWGGKSGLSVSLTYSYQDVPISDGVAMNDRIDVVRAETEAGVDLDGDGKVADTTAFVNIPARHRLSGTIGLARPRWGATATADYVAQTFWQDVLTSDFWGYVPSYTLVGVRGSYVWPKKHLKLGVQVTNLLDEPIQQHIYGDIIGRRAGISLTYGWPGPSQGTTP
jgi:outer membrane receptor protein involved in Fe transport